MEDLISLVLVAAVVAVGTVGLFGRRHGRPAVIGEHPGDAVRHHGAGSHGGSHGQPPAYRIVQPPAAAGPPAPMRPVPAGPVGVPAGPGGVHDGATQLMPAVMLPDDEEGPEGPDPDAVLLARGRPSGTAQRGAGRTTGPTGT